MTVTVEERYDSRRKTVAGEFDFSIGSTGAPSIATTSIQVEYVVMGAVDVTEAIEETFAQIPSSVEGLVLDTISCDEEPIDAVHITTATYKAIKSNNNSGGDGGDTFTFDTTGGSTHITQSLETLDYESFSLIPLDPDVAEAGAINADGDTVDGVDIVTPVFNFTETRWMSSLQVTQAYKLQVSELTGKVNVAPFRGFAAGEVLFMGANGSRSQGTNRWQITFSFAVKRNQVDIPVINLTIPSKRGWDYLWFTYDRSIDNQDAYLKPSSYRIERIYEDGDFDLLGIEEPHDTPYGL